MTKAPKKTTKRARKAATKTAPIKPIYLQSGSIEIGLHDVIKALKMIEKHGHLRKLSRDLELRLSVPAETVNFIKDFIVQYDMYDNPIGKHIVGGNGRPEPSPRAAASRAGSGGPYECDFGR
jgi:hypothetical protein